MNVEYHKWFSQNLGQNMELKVFGHVGKPILVFPTQSGRFFQFEDGGMIEAMHEFIDEGKYCAFCVDSVDDQSWCAWDLPIDERVHRHEAYERYLLMEVLPFISQHQSNSTSSLLALGCSLGGYHAANLFFRRPDVFDSVISLSGLFDLRCYIGEFFNESVYFLSPIDYLSNLTDEWYLERYRRGRIILACGGGAWEDLARSHLETMKKILTEKKIPAWIDFWGGDVNHDWIWWRRMLPYFLAELDSPTSADWV